MPAGRPTLYREAYDEQAYKLALLGLDDVEMASFFEVNPDTLHEWKKVHPTFSESINRGKQPADSQIALAMYDRARGAEWIEQQAFKVKISQFEERIEVIDIKRAAPPDTQAASLWLRNRRPKNWRDRQEIDHTVNTPASLANDATLLAIAFASGSDGAASKGDQD